MPGLKSPGGWITGTLRLRILEHTRRERRYVNYLKEFTHKSGLDSALERMISDFAYIGPALYPCTEFVHILCSPLLTDQKSQNPADKSDVFRLPFNTHPDICTGLWSFTSVEVVICKNPVQGKQVRRICAKYGIFSVADESGSVLQEITLVNIMIYHICRVFLQNSRRESRDFFYVDRSHRLIP